MKLSRHYSLLDRFILESDQVLRIVLQGSTGRQPDSPATNLEENTLNDQEKRRSAGLMRVNHTGEVCAQALYRGQALTAKRPSIRKSMKQAVAEETDHLNWCQHRLQQLSDRPSRLNPLFYGLSFSMGAFTGAISDKISLGFVAATEELVCKHLQKHLRALPEKDCKSRAIVAQMLKDEARHQQAALDAGGANLPDPVKQGMSLLSKAMTKTTYYL